MDDALDHSRLKELGRQLKNAGTAYLYVFSFETLLRDHVREVLEATYSQQYKEEWLSFVLRRVGDDLPEKLEERIARQVRGGLYLAMSGNETFAFLTLNELKLLVVKHWNHFRPVFRDRIQFEASCDKIAFVRNAVMHSRAINDDVLEELKDACSKFILALLSEGRADAIQPSAFGVDLVEEIFTDRHADVLRVFSTRSQFQEAVGYDAFFRKAKLVQAMGLSLNAIALNFGAQRLIRLIEEQNTTVQLLFLDPEGKNTKKREKQEGYQKGHIAGVTRTSIAVMAKVARELSPEKRGLVSCRLYDETARLNIYIVDDQYLVAQHYMPSAMGVDCPCLLIKRGREDGLFHQYKAAFDSIWSGRSWPINL